METFMHNRRALLTIALGTLAASVASEAIGQTSGNPQSLKEKCFGIAKVGQNDCAAANCVHTCKGQYKEGLDPRAEWKFVAKGTCESKEVGGNRTYQKAK